MDFYKKRTVLQKAKELFYKNKLLKYEKKILSVLAAALFWLVSCCIATAQGVAQSDQITDGDTQEIIQADSSSTAAQPRVIRASRVKKPRLVPLDVRISVTIGAMPVPSHDTTWSPLK